MGTAERTVDEAVVRRLIRSQFRQWSELPIRALPAGWDNRSFRLGDDMLVRLPSAEVYATQVDKEQRWLPVLAAKLPVPIPKPIARGEPGDGYPWPWSVYGWIAGETATLEAVADSRTFATDLADFLLALQAIDATHGPAAGAHSFHRGGSLSVYDAETRNALRILGPRVDAQASAVWNAALASRRLRRPAWVHGDIALGNLLRRGDRLCGVIDFGQLAVGDPACDVSIAWTVFRGDSRRAFQEKLAVDDATWLRSRAWALWKAVIVAAGLAKTNAAEWTDPWRVMAEVLGT
jgi:aminoglycoside phosphotransferase (APT) family kinase protein